MVFLWKAVSWKVQFLDLALGTVLLTQCERDSPLPPNSVYISLKQGIILHNTIIKIKKLTSIDYYHLIYRTYSNFASCPTYILIVPLPTPNQSRGSRIAFNCHISLVFISLEQFQNFIDHLVKMVYTSFLHCKVTILPFVISICVKIFWDYMPPFFI